MEDKAIKDLEQFLLNDIKAIKKPKNRTMTTTVLTTSEIKEHTQLRTSRDIDNALGVIADHLKRNKVNLRFFVTEKEAWLSLFKSVRNENFRL